MKIAQVTPFFYPVEGGVEKHVLNVSRELIRRGHEVHVLTSDSTYGERRIEVQREIIDGIHVHRFHVFFNIGTFAKFWPGIFRELLREKYDVIHTHVYRHPHSDMALLASKSRKEKCVLTTHSPFHPYEVRKRTSQILAKLYDNLNGKILTSKFDAIIAVHSGEVSNIMNLGVEKERIHVIPNGLETEHFKDYSPMDFLEKYNIDRDFILYLGKLHETKGVDFLIKSFRKVVDKASEALLVIAGSGRNEYEESLRKLVKNLELRKNVIFVGFISEEMKMKVYSACRFFVLPSIYEPFGIVLLEAMAHGKPVISTRLGGPSDIVRDGYTGFLVDYGNEDEIVDRMMRLINDNHLAKKMGKSAKEEAKKYVWPKIADEILGVYESILIS